MTKTTLDTARCTIRGLRIEVRRNQTEAATYNVGIDGWLVAVAPTADRAIWEVTESIRVNLSNHAAPNVPQRFRDAVAGL